MMPFSLEELVVLSRCLRDACLGIIKLAYPDTKPEVREGYSLAFQSVGVATSQELQQCVQLQQKRWVQLFKVGASKGVGRGWGGIVVLQTHPPARTPRSRAPSPHHRQPGLSGARV